MSQVSWMRSTTALLFLVALAGCSQPFTSQIQDEEEGESVPIPELTPEERADLAQMREPELSATQTQIVMSKYDHVDPGHIIPQALRQKALSYYDANLSHIPNKAVLSVADFTARSSQARLFVIDMVSGAVSVLHVAHGSGSDPKKTGYARKFSNRPGSLMTSLGFYRTAETYNGKHGLSLRLDGLSSTNSNARRRAIVVHSASYVTDADVVQGRSSGCLAVSIAAKPELVERLKQGSVIYAGLQ